MAIEIALGAGLQNIVVDREEDAKAAISYLKRGTADGPPSCPSPPSGRCELREQGVRREAGFVGLGDELVPLSPIPEYFFQPAGPHCGGGGPGLRHRHGPEVPQRLPDRDAGRPGH